MNINIEANEYDPIFDIVPDQPGTFIMNIDEEITDLINKYKELFDCIDFKKSSFLSGKEVNAHNVIKYYVASASDKLGYLHELYQIFGNHCYNHHEHECTADDYDSEYIFALLVEIDKKLKFYM